MTPLSFKHFTLQFLLIYPLTDLSLLSVASLPIRLLGMLSMTICSGESPCDSVLALGSGGLRGDQRPGWIRFATNNPMQIATTVLSINSPPSRMAVLPLISVVINTCVTAIRISGGARAPSSWRMIFAGNSNTIARLPSSSPSTTPITSAPRIRPYSGHFLQWAISPGAASVVESIVRPALANRATDRLQSEPVTRYPESTRAAVPCGMTCDVHSSRQLLRLLLHGGSRSWGGLLFDGLQLLGLGPLGCRLGPQFIQSCLLSLGQLDLHLGGLLGL